MRTAGALQKASTASLFRRSKRPAGALAALVFCLLGHLVWAADVPERPTEAQVKAAYLYNFGKFVRWPAPPETDSFDICILGKNPFGPALNSIVAGERIQGTRIVARDLSSLAEAPKCRILFISKSEEGRMKATLAGLKSATPLTVSDIP
jgi:YfiR/HmsC-like